MKQFFTSLLKNKLKPILAGAVVFSSYTTLAQSYCIPNYGNGTGSGDFISLIEIQGTTLNNPSGGNGVPSYNTFPQSGSTTANLIAGTSYSLNVRGGTYSTCFIAGWGDWNQNGIFETTEYIGVSGNVGNQTLGSFTFSVPVSSNPGTIRLRFRSSDTGPGPIDTEACGNTNSGFGEAEDYDVFIVPATTCTGTPTAGDAVSSYSAVCPGKSFNLSLVNNIVDGGIEYQWQSSTDGSNWSNLGTPQVSWAYLINNLNADTYYRCITTCTAAAASSTSTPIQVLLNSYVNCYCTPQFQDCSGGDSFNSIDFLTISDQSLSCNAGNNGYEDRTALGTPTVSAGQTFSLNFNVNNGNNGNGIIGAWIDEDHNAVFDPWEYRNLTTVAGSGSYISYVSIPVTAMGGNTRIRFKLEASGSSITSQDPCLQQNYYGQVYDYMLSITAAPSCAGTPNAGSAVANPTLVCHDVPITLNLFGVNESGVSYQWQSSLDGNTWTNLGTSQNIIPYTVPSQTVSTYYRCELTCNSSSLTAASNTVMVSQITPTNCYCTPASLDCSNITISDISFATLSETVACVGGGYSDNSWSSPTVSVTANQTYTLSSNILCPSGNGHLGAWIDYNKNGVFEQYEFSFIGYSSTGTITNTIAIPFTASGGNYKMRVKLEFDWGYPHLLEPCNNNASEGITLDYLLDVTPAPACAGTPNAGDAVASQTLACANTKLTLTLTNNDITSGNTYQWQESTDNTNWTNLGAPQSFVMYELYTANVDKYYRCLVTCQNSSLTAASNTVAVIQNAITNCYCTPPPADCSGSDITNVSFSNLNNSSTCNATDGYTDYTQSVASASISAGQTYTLTTTHSNDFNNEVAIWIDYDKNGIFDSNEYSYVGSSAGSGIYDISGSVSIPVNAPLGNTRMRVRVGYYADWQSNQACDAPSGGAFRALPFSYDGETEDYLVTIMPPDCSVLNIPPSVTATIDNDTVCSGNQIVLDIAPAMPFGTGFGYQWKSSPDGSTYTDIGSPLTASSLSLNPTAATYYICEVQCNTNPAVTSSSVMVTISAMTSIITSTDITCYGLTNGQAEILVSGGITPHTFTWSPGGATTSLVNSLAQGTYTCQVTDAIGCTTSNTVTINEPSAITTAITISGNVSCNGMSDGSATISANGGTGTLLYSWMPAGGTTTTAINLSAGSYTCTVTDGNSCTATETVTITEPTPLTAVTSQTNVTCYGGNNGIASVSVTGGTPNYTYFWSHGFGAAGNTISGNVSAQTYSCTITDANNCSITQTIAVTEAAQITLSISGNTTACITAPSTFSVSVTNAVGALTYTWSASPTGSVSNNATFDFTATAAGTETIYVNVTDANGCSQLSNGYPVVVAPSTDISGTILDASNSSPVSGIVILYKYEPFFTKFDSVSYRTIDAAGNYTFTPVNYGQYIVKAVPTNTVLQITYGTNSVNWKTATIINHGCANSDIQNINVVPLATLAQGGIGELSGQIREGDGFGKRVYSPTTPLAPGNPIGGIIVKGGKNPGGNMFTQTVTDQNGNYTLSGLPINTGEQFFILVDIPGLDTNSTYRKILTTGNPVYTGLDFIVDSMKITPVENAVGINEINMAEHQIKLFPNPAKNKVTIKYNLPSSSVVSIGLYDMLGKELKAIIPATTQVKDEYSYTVQLNDITSGMYFVKLRINNSESTIKLVITD